MKTPLRRYGPVLVLVLLVGVWRPGALASAGSPPPAGDPAFQAAVEAGVPVQPVALRFIDPRTGEGSERTVVAFLENALAAPAV